MITELFELNKNGVILRVERDRGFVTISLQDQDIPFDFDCSESADQEALNRLIDTLQRFRACAEACLYPVTNDDE